MIEARVVDAKVDDPNGCAAILKEKDNNRYMSVWIGQNQAHSIVNKTPYTVTVFNNVLGSIGVKLTKIEIYEHDGPVYFSRIYISLGSKGFDLETGDALVLAAQCDLPVFVDNHIFNKNAIDGPTQDELERFRHLVGDLDETN